MHSNHTFSRKEIQSIPAGRILDTIIQEYVLGDYPTRWSNGEQKEISSHWFEEHPRSCAEDDGGYCSADGLARYSTDISAASALAELAVLTGKTLSTKRLVDTESVGYRNDTTTTFWATFSASENENKNWKQTWAYADTLPLAICRAALLAV